MLNIEIVSTQFHLCVGQALKYLGYRAMVRDQKYHAKYQVHLDFRTTHASQMYAEKLKTTQIDYWFTTIWKKKNCKLRDLSNLFQQLIAMCTKDNLTGGELLTETIRAFLGQLCCVSRTYPIYILTESCNRKSIQMKISTLCCNLYAPRHIDTISISNYMIQGKKIVLQPLSCLD